MHFRHRIGEKVVGLIPAKSIRVNDDDRTGNGDQTAFIDSTVQKKNITYPTDAKFVQKYYQALPEDSCGLKIALKLLR